MDKSNLLKLTKDSYRLTLLFPKREPLRCKIRETADDILAGVIMSKKNDTNGVDDQLEVIDGFFEVARDQNWVSLPMLDDVRNGYKILRLDLANAAVEALRSVAVPVAEAQEPAVKESVIYAPAAAVPPLIGHVISAESRPVAKTELPVLDEEPSQNDDKEEEGEGVGELTEGQAIRQNRIVEYLKEKGQAQVWEIQKIFPNISKRTIRRDFRSLLKQELIERVGERNRTYYKLKVNII